MNMSSDHLAIAARLNVEPICFNRPDHVHRKYSWNKYSPIEIAQTYGITLTSLLDNKIISDCSSMCADEIDNYYIFIVEELQQASFKTIPLCRFQKHVKPKWSSEVAPFHAAMRAKRILWIRAGRPRDNENPRLYSIG